MASSLLAYFPRLSLCLSLTHFLCIIYVYDVLSLPRAFFLFSVLLRWLHNTQKYQKKKIMFCDALLNVQFLIGQLSWVVYLLVAREEAVVTVATIDQRQT